jgi:hypothetical protein
MATLEMEIPDEKIQKMLRGDRGIAVLLEPVLNQILQSELSEHLRGRESVWDYEIIFGTTTSFGIREI